MIKELDTLSRNFKQQDVDVLIEEISLFQNDLTKAAQRFLKDAEKIAVKQKKPIVTIVGVIHE